MSLQFFPHGDAGLERETMVGLGILLVKATGAASFISLLLACRGLFLPGDVLTENGMSVEWSWDRRTRTAIYLQYIKFHEGKELNWTEFERNENKVVCKMLK